MRSFALPGQNRPLNISPCPRMIQKYASQISRAQKKFLAGNRESVSKRELSEQSSIFANRLNGTEPDGEGTLESTEWNAEQQRRDLRDNRGSNRSDVPTSSGARCIVSGAIALTEKCQLVCHSDTYPRPRDYELFGILELERGWLLNEKSPRTFHVSRCETKCFNIKQAL